MKVISTNLGKSTTIHWNSKEEKTGIFKYPVAEPIFLGLTKVEKDTITDRKHHGGSFKACYLFSSTYYPFWQERYPSLDWDWGMFGENITVKGMDEAQLIIGSVYQLGNALVQITIPREPCYKLGIRFKDQKIIKEFIEHGHPGTYVRVLNEGTVQKGDSFLLQDQANHNVNISDFYRMLYAKEKDQDLLKIVQGLEAIPKRTRDKLSRY
ncbi:MOSC domain-containing protein [uncultured Muriicola sp.]|uniref:MOSC domain-containing protein n=1 Tax=uncultured Muriicola sp. TaxID=1583102 RepID=UPI002637DA9B|nr:MOSC domain-containing protein [uncultured Muriicola sp.]